MNIHVMNVNNYDILYQGLWKLLYNQSTLWNILKNIIVIMYNADINAI